MSTNSVWVKVDGDRVVLALQEAREKLGSVQGELVLDFSSVHRIDPESLRAMEKIADTVDGNGTKVVLRGVNIDIYKVLKLMKLSPRFAFRT